MTAHSEEGYFVKVTGNGADGASSVSKLKYAHNNASHLHDVHYQTRINWSTRANGDGQSVLGDVLSGGYWMGQSHEIPWTLNATGRLAVPVVRLVGRVDTGSITNATFAVSFQLASAAPALFGPSVMRSWVGSLSVSTTPVVQIEDSGDFQGVTSNSSADDAGFDPLSSLRSWLVDEIGADGSTVYDGQATLVMVRVTTWAKIVAATPDDRGAYVTAFMVREAVGA